MGDYRFWTLLISLAAMLSGCADQRIAGGTGVGNPTKGYVTLSMVAASGGSLAKTSASPRNPDGSFDIRDSGGTVFTVRASLVNVGHIRLSLPDELDCGDADETACEGNEITIPGPMVADLMTGVWTPALKAFPIPVGKYNRMDVRLEAADDKSSPPDPVLAGHSMIFKGLFGYAGKGDRAFSIALDFDEDARFHSDTDFVVSKGSSNLTVVLEIEKWLSRVDIAACLDRGDIALDAEGNLSVDKSNSCDGLEDAVKDAVKNSGRVEGRHESD